MIIEGSLLNANVRQQWLNYFYLNNPKVTIAIDLGEQWKLSNEEILKLVIYFLIEKPTTDKIAEMAKEHTNNKLIT